MAVILVSSCLLGCSCRYKGDHCRCEPVLALAGEHILVGVCPEQLGGLPTPREPAERVGDRVLTRSGLDVTEAYARGAREALRLARISGAEAAILKYRSPACGRGRIYDGTFTGTLIPGDGVFAQLLLEQGIPVYSEEDLKEN